VSQLYEIFPYPSPEIDAALIEDVANGLGLLLCDREWRQRQVLDVGCGTGHRLVALAQRYPQARFLGVDASSNSLDVARRIAEVHDVPNVESVPPRGALVDYVSALRNLVKTQLPDSVPPEFIVLSPDPQRTNSPLPTANGEHQ
jgi:SAM-dependent methyltransferase